LTVGGNSEQSTLPNITRFAISTHDIPPALLSDVRTRVQLPESVADDEEDKMSDFGLSEAGAEGLRALFEDGLLQDKPVYPKSTIMNNIGDTSMPRADDLSGQTISMSSDIQETKSADPFQSPNAYETPHAQSQQNLGQGLIQGISMFRQPSPSDAAMAKSGTISRNDIGVGVFGKPTVQSLGDMSGKGAFFEAREINKTKFSDGENERTEPSSMEDSAPNLGAVFTDWYPRNPQQSTVAGSNFNRSCSPVIVPSNSFPSPSVSNIAKSSKFPQSLCPTIFGKPHFSMSPTIKSRHASLTGLDFPTRDACSFLDKPDQTMTFDRPSSPLPDMTSAFSYSTSKDSMDAQITPPTNPRSGIKINDIIESSSVVHRTNVLKRKAVDISDVPENELRLWGNNSTTSDNSNSAPVYASNELVANSPAPKDVTQKTDTTEPRPTKRLKKILENVGYAALGGVAVGASLFTVLVATAPDFL
jgi:hypothetical protein